MGNSSWKEEEDHTLSIRKLQLESVMEGCSLLEVRKRVLSGKDTPPSLRGGDSTRRVADAPKSSKLPGQVLGLSLRICMERCPRAPGGVELLRKEPRYMLPEAQL